MRPLPGKWGNRPMFNASPSENFPFEVYKEQLLSQDTPDKMLTKLHIYYTRLNTKSQRYYLFLG